MVTAGTHLERLYQLRKRVDQEIAIEEARRGKPAAPKKATPASSSVRRHPQSDHPRPQSDLELMVELRVTTRMVRKWAEEEGLIPRGQHGRIKTSVIEAYGEAHQ